MMRCAGSKDVQPPPAHKATSVTKPVHVVKPAQPKPVETKVITGQLVTVQLYCSCQCQSLHAGSGVADPLPKKASGVVTLYPKSEGRGLVVSLYLIGMHLSLVYIARFICIPVTL